MLFVKKSKPTVVCISKIPHQTLVLKLVFGYSYAFLWNCGFSVIRVLCLLNILLFINVHSSVHTISRGKFDESPCAKLHFLDIRYACLLGKRYARKFWHFEILWTKLLLVSYSSVTSLVEACGLSSVVISTHNYSSLRF